MLSDAAFWDRIAPKYARDPIADMAAYELTLERSLSYLSPEDRVLELGCGTGSTALRIAPHVKHILATDISREMIAIAKAKDAASGNVEFEALGVAEALRGAEADAILAFNLFHLLAEAPACFAQLHAALRTGGLFISKTPCLADESLPKRAAFRVMIPAMRLVGKAPSFVRHYTRTGLEAEIEAAGFEIVETLDAPALSRYIVARKT